MSSNYQCRLCATLTIGAAANEHRVTRASSRALAAAAKLVGMALTDVATQQGGHSDCICSTIVNVGPEMKCICKASGQSVKLHTGPQMLKQSRKNANSHKRMDEIKPIASSSGSGQLGSGVPLDIRFDRRPSFTEWLGSYAGVRYHLPLLSVVAALLDGCKAQSNPRDTWPLKLGSVSSYPSGYPPNRLLPGS